jgi:hypothetical protein
MPALDASLAFAITMLVLAMVVTTLVETLHRLFGLREKGLALLLGQFYDRVLARRIGSVPDATQQRDWFIDMMTVNRGPVGRAPMIASLGALRLDARLEDKKFLNWIWGGRRLGSLSLTAFMERLGGSEHGLRLMGEVSAAGDKAIEWTLKDIGQKFEAFGQEASEYFESRARLLSVIVGFVVAIALHVDAFMLFDTFMRRPDIAQQVIAQGDKVTKAYQEAQKKADASGTNVSDEVKQTKKALEAELEPLRTAGVPVGWTPRAVVEFKEWSVTDLSNPFWKTLFGMLLGGLLIGLGAPFWYQAVQMLTGLRGATRQEKTTSTAAGAPGGAAAPAPEAPNQLPQTPIDAFHVALGAALASGELQPSEEAVG